MATLPLSTDFTGASVTEAQFKNAIAQQRDFLSGLLAATGAQGDALGALGAILGGFVAKTASYTVVTSDRGKLIGCSGTWVITLPPVATAGIGFSVAIKNTGTGTITVDGAGSEQIDGGFTKALAANDATLLVCSGSAWFSVHGIVPPPTVDEIQPYTTGSVTKLIAASAAGSATTTPTRFVEWRIPKGGELYVHMYAAGQQEYGTSTAYARIYINGAAVGTLRSFTVTGSGNWYETIVVAEGDKLQLYGWTSNVYAHVTGMGGTLLTGLTSGFLIPSINRGDPSYSGVQL